MDELEIVTAAKHISKLAVKSLRAGKIPTFLGLRGQLALIYDGLVRVEDKITVNEIYKIAIRALLCAAMARKKDAAALLEDEFEIEEPQGESFSSSEQLTQHVQDHNALLAKQMMEELENSPKINPLAEPEEGDERFQVETGPG